MANSQVSFFNNVIKDIIQKQRKNDIQILCIKKENVLPPSENYNGELLRVTATFCENNSNDVNSISLVTKMSLGEGHEEETKFFSSEIAFYNEILPLLNKLEYQKKFSPNSYYTSKIPKYIIVLEDLPLVQYKMYNRIEGLDLEHCLITIEKLAYFHAASLLLYEQNPAIMDTFNREAIYQTKLFKKWDTMVIKEVLKTCQKTPSLQKYTNLISQDLLDKYSTIRNIDPKLNVLNHGDLWCNNLMFQYDENGRVNDVLFVDFQVASFTSPFLDLHFFLATSPNLDVKRTHTNTIVKHYYETFLKDVYTFNLKTKIPDYEEFFKEFCDKAYLGFGITITFSHIVKADKRKDASVSNFLENEGEGSFRHHCFTNSNYLSLLECSLSFYESLGLFANREN